MQAKLGPLVTTVAGSIGGTTFQRSPIATIVRAKPLPTLRRTQYTDTARATTGSWSQQWRSLSQVDRDAWQATADGLTWTNRFGDVIRGKGYWLFMRCNQYLQLLGEPTVSTPGTVAALDAIVGAGGNFGPALNWPIVWSSPGAVGSNQRWLIFATPPLSPGRSASFGQTRYIGFIRDRATSPRDAYSDYVARFGSPVPTGRVVFVTLLPVDFSTGYPGVPVSFTATT